jgi:hypothetical protein
MNYWLDDADQVRLRVVRAAAYAHRLIVVISI